MPAIVHVDGSARLQTVSKEDVPRYYALILAFFLACGVPMVMNTSFNIANMPIVETPADAIACFLVRVTPTDHVACTRDARRDAMPTHATRPSPDSNTPHPTLPTPSTANRAQLPTQRSRPPA